MIRTSIIIFLLGISLAVFAEDPQDTVELYRVRIEISGIIHTWNAGEKVPAKSDEGYTEPLTVLSFLTLAPGMRMSRSELEREAFLCEHRLRKSGFFYDARCIVIESADTPGKIMLFISVTEGFLYRFGGGNAYGMFGRDNISGQRKSFRVYAGWNYAGALYRDYLAAGTHFFAGLDGFFIRSDRILRREYVYKAADISMLAGYRFFPDTYLSFSFKHRFIDIAYIHPERKGTEPIGVSRKIYAGTELKMQTYMRLLTGTADVSALIAAEEIFGSYGNAGKTRFVSAFHSVGENVSFNIQLSSGMTYGMTGYTDWFNLCSSADMSVRSGYAPDNLLVRNYAMMNAEIRFGIFHGTLPPSFPFDITGFVFSDFARGSYEARRLMRAETLDAYGAGLRLLFDNPVFAYFLFSYGVNRKGNGRFSFSGNAGF